jgi:hypothetical protein
MFPEVDDLRARVVKLEKKLAILEDQTFAPAVTVWGRRHRHCVRRRSTTELLGLPLWEVAWGADFSRGERCGHAKAIFAMGDIATGVFAMGGIARGLFAFGGVAFGGFTFGGLSLGLVVALGGAAIGLGFSAGGLAVGTVAIGGAALGLFSVGGLTVGLHRIGPPLRF